MSLCNESNLFSLSKLSSDYEQGEESNAYWKEKINELHHIKDAETSNINKMLCDQNEKIEEATEETRL